jgi:hypothetical protein
VWARGRRDEIGARITKDLISYEGWPASLMPDAAVVSTSDASLSTALVRAVVADCPAWAPYVGSQAEAAHVDRVLLSVPPPEQPSHRLEVVHLNDAVQIIYKCSEPGLRAAAQFRLDENDNDAVVFCVCEFLRELREREMIVLMRPLDLVARWRRRDGARYRAHFRSVSRSVSYSARFVYEWHAERGHNAG